VTPAGGLAILLAVVVGIVLGTTAALRQNSWVDYTVMAAAMTGIAIPVFVMAPLLTLIFGVFLGWLPVAGWGDGGIRHLLLPVVAFALPQIAFIARLTRGSMIEVLNAPYIRTARAKGLRERIVVGRHALKASLLPVVSYLAPAATQLITGSVVIETIFGIPGIGRYFVQGALNRDYTLVMGTVIVYALVIIILNLMADLAYGFLDPKIKQR
jgi:oligopeptide transport system permease protein